MDFLNALFSSIRAKITPLWTKMKLWTSPSFIRTRVITKIRTFFTKTLSIKPRHKDDYYVLSRWMVSKRLVFAAVMFIGVVSLYYLVSVNPISVFSSSTNGIRTYKYNSLPLRFLSDQVNIKAKKGYVAYTGTVKKGKAEGQGILYREDGSVLYTGAFDKSMYNGSGKLYFDSGQLEYEGSFADNLFDGSGTLFRENGSMAYAGNFRQGMKEGTGILYDTGSNQVYSGNFTSDGIVYSDLLGKTTDDLASCYMGGSRIYAGDELFAVVLKDINAMYYGSSTEDSLDGSMAVDGLYVLEGSIWVNGKECADIADLDKAFAAKAYEGNSQVTLPEAVAISQLNEKENALFGAVTLNTEQIFSDVISVKSYDTSYYIYLYSYSKDGLVYTFFCRERHGAFAMYLIEKEET